jgi:hypothetical protein
VGSPEAAKETKSKIEAHLTLKQFEVAPPKRKEEVPPTYEEYATLWRETKSRP